jgi:hypothetical protein
VKKNIHILIFVLFLIYLYIFLTMSKTTPFYLLPSDKIFIKEKIVYNDEISKIIENINLKNNNIDSIFVKNMPIILQQGRIKIRANGELAMEKEKKFRLEINHRITGKEMDIGSNENYFWFWSKRMNPPYLNFAKHEDLDKTFLRNALNPNWILESMNINLIDIKNIEVYKIKNFYSISQKRTSVIGDQITAIMIIDPKEKRIIGRYLYDENNKMIASTEYKNFKEDVARKILIIWYEEGITLDWDLTEAKINQKIDTAYWVMPDIKKKIDLSK